MQPKNRNFKTVLFLCLGYLFVSSSIVAEESPGESALQSGFGFLLIRVIGTRDERVGIFELTNLDTGDVIKTKSNMYKWSRPTAGICLVAVPAGRYFWSAYQPDYHYGLWRLDSSRWDAKSPRTSNDLFEIVPEVINYAGDWTIEMSRLTDMKVRISIDVSFDIETLESAVDLYPEYANAREFYLSMRGKKAISLVEFQRIVEENPVPINE